MELSRWIESTFKVHERGSSIRTEIEGGVVMFCTCAYIMIMNPKVLLNGAVNPDASFYSTVIVTIIGSFSLGWFANLPFVLSPAMGLNTLVAIELVHTKNIPYEKVIFGGACAGLVLILLSQSGLLHRLVRLTPLCVKKAVIVSLGLYQAVIGLTNLTVIEPNPPGTISGISRLSHLTTPPILLGGLTVIIALLLVVNGVDGALLYSIVICSIISKFLGGDEETVAHQAPFPTFNFVGELSPPALGDLTQWLNFLLSFSIIFLVSIIDAGGVLVGLPALAPVLADEETGLCLKSQTTFTTIGVSGMISAYLGCSPPVVLLESAAGLNYGARTGIASIVTALMFMLCMIFQDLVSLVPNSVCFAILIVVGSFMMGAVDGIAWHDISEAFPAYGTILATVLTCSLFNGIVVGILTYSLLKLPFVNYHTSAKLPDELGGDVETTTIEGSFRRNSVDHSLLWASNGDPTRSFSSPVGARNRTTVTSLGNEQQILQSLI